MLVAKVEGTRAIITSTLHGVWATEELVRLGGWRGAPYPELELHRRQLRPLKDVIVNRRTFEAVKSQKEQPVRLVVFTQTPASVPTHRFIFRFTSPGTLYIHPADDWRVLCGLPDDVSYQGTPTNTEHRNVLPTWALTHLGAVCVHCGADLTGTDRQTWVEPECAGGCAT